MARSFFTGTDAELYNGTINFSTMISATPSAYGLSAPQAASYATLSDSYKVAYETIQTPSTRTKGAVAAKNAAKILLRVAASDLAKIIEGTSTVTDQQKIDLGLNVRKTPGPMGPPGTCTDFKVKLHADGSIETTFKANNPTGMSGVTYQVWRRFGSVGEFTFLFGTGEKKFVDSTIPAGTAQVQYQIRGIRPTSAGAWAQFNVNFGQTGSGTMMASVVETQVEPKIAA
jgi:hypothetical protein